MSPETKILLLSLTIASVGFILWYVISSSLRLPIRYQIMYDVNSAYVSRILRRRSYAVIIYGVIPLALISCCHYFGPRTPEELNIHFIWNSQVFKISLLGSIAATILSWFGSKSHSSLEIYPEVRVRFWETDVLVKSGLSWILYIVAYEFFYRGLLLQSLLFHLDKIPAIFTCAALYCLTHYFKLNRITFMSIAWGLIAPWIVIEAGSLWPLIIIHLVLSLSIEWFSILHHKEMYVRRT